MQGFLLRLLISALALWIAAAIVPSMHFASGWTLLWAALLLGAVNAIVRPLFILLTLPITVLTLGIFLLVVNAAMLALVAGFLGGFELGEFGSAFFGALIVSLVSWFASSFIGPRGEVQIIYTKHDDRR